MTDNAKDSRSRKKRNWIGLGQLLLILAIFGAVQWWRSEPLASGRAPSLAGTLISGNEAFDLAQLHGRPVLVHFWATWCPVCKLGDESIQSIARDFRVITVAMQSGGAVEIADHMRREGISFPVLPDPRGEHANVWGVSGVPASFVLDGAGNIRFATVGYTTEVGLRGRLWAAAHLD